MKIWIDGYEANVLQRLGSSQVAFELLKSLEKIDVKNDYTILLPTPLLEDLPKEREGWKYRILKPKRLWTKITLPLTLYSARQKPDLIFSPTHYIPRFSPRKVKRIVTIFDLSFLHFPEMFTKRDLWQLKNWTKFSLDYADHIITISKFSKQDIVSQYGVDKNKITVAYPGYDREKFKIQNVSKETAFSRAKSKLKEVKRKYKIGDNYLIYVGTIQPRKNLIRLIEAFQKIEKPEYGKRQILKFVRLIQPGAKINPQTDYQIDPPLPINILQVLSLHRHKLVGLVMYLVQNVLLLLV